MPDRKPSSQPWTIDERAECLIVSDTRGNSLAHVYFEDEPTRRDLTKRLSKYDARRDGAADLASIGTGRARAPVSQPAMTWSRRFDEPIVLPDGGRLAPLRQAGDCISALPAATQNQTEWQAAIEAPILVAEHGGDTLLPRIAMMRALNAGKPQPTIVRTKRIKTYRIIR
jgi:hypothetical protein